MKRQPARRKQNGDRPSIWAILLLIVSVLALALSILLWFVGDHLDHVFSWWTA